MPTRPEGVYPDRRGGWYFKVTLGRDLLTGRRDQVTRRGFATAAEAGRARREVVAKADAGLIKSSPGGLTVDALLDLYLDGIDADERLSPQDPPRLPGVRSDLRAAPPRRPQGARRHARGGPDLAATPDQGGRDQDRQAARP